MKYQQKTFKKNRLGGWSFTLHYEDDSGFPATVKGFGFKSEHAAKIAATKRRNDIKENKGF